MGYRTPNIDRIAKEGALFTDWYGQQSCTAGRSAFITGQSPIRTGLIKVGLPGAPEGLSKSDPTIAELLKPLGYATGQFGKNHLGDRNEHPADGARLRRVLRQPLPPQRRGGAGERGLPEGPGVQHALRPARRPALPRHGDGGGGPPTRASAPGGKQKCEDTGPLTRKRMETVDREFLTAAEGFIDKAHKADKPFFVWFNTTRMHIWTHLTPGVAGKTGIGRLPRRHGRARRHGRRAAAEARRARHRERHHRHVLDRQRCRDDELAGRRHDAVPRREEHQLGRRLPRPVR